VSPAESTEYEDEIGLMYVSDYMYAASPTYWTYIVNDTPTTDYRAAINEDWMYSGFSEWSITRNSDSTDSSFRWFYSGTMYIACVYNDDNGVRPVFNIKSSIKYLSGTGTKNDPFRITY